MADTARARSSLGFAERFVNGVAGDLRTRNLTEEQRFTLLWDLAYQVYRLLEEHRIPEVQHYDPTVCDGGKDFTWEDGLTKLQKEQARAMYYNMPIWTATQRSPYKGSDSVPF